MIQEGCSTPPASTSVNFFSTSMQLFPFAKQECIPLSLLSISGACSFGHTTPPWNRKTACENIALPANNRLVHPFWEILDQPLLKNSAL